MRLDAFITQLRLQKSDDELLDFCRKYVLHGIPYVFQGQEEMYYEFRKRISVELDVPFYEVYITGSAKLGFSPFKRTEFDYNSDIDVALISPVLFERFMRKISGFQMEFRRARAVVRESELNMYHEFLEYVALGWIRPDKLPVSFQMRTIKTGWFEFFKSISYGRSEVGDYKVNAGVFKSYDHLEDYIVSGLRFVRDRRSLEKGI